MKGWADVEIGGHVGTADIKLRSMGGDHKDKAVCDVSICANVNKGDKPLWVKGVFFGGLAEMVAKNVKKGEPVHIRGRLRTEEWEKDGKNNFSIVCEVSEFHFLSSGTKGEESQQEKPKPRNPDDIPF